MNAASKKVIDINGIDITLSRKRVKNINLRISQKNGEVLVSAPRSVSEDYIVAFLQSKFDWISERKQAAQLRQKRNTFSYLNGETHRFLGEEYPLCISPFISATNRQPRQLNSLTRIDDASFPKSIVLSCQANASREEREAILYAWYRKELQTLLPTIVEAWCTKMGTSVEEYRIKKMKTKWGTCNIRDRRIWINLELIKYPIECIEYVVLHELAHLFERNHSARFYRIVEDHMPDWRKWENILDES